METANSELKPVSKELGNFRNGLLQYYKDIEGKAVAAIREGSVVGNPMLENKAEETRYALSVIGLIKGPARAFLEDVCSRIQHVEPDARYVPDGFRHLTFGEVFFNPTGRKVGGITAQAAKGYYNALREHFGKGFNPIQLELVKIIPSLDSAQFSVSLIALFLPKEDLNILNIRQGVNQAVVSKGLPLSARLGSINIIHSTLARFINPPKREGLIVPFLEELKEINDSIPEDLGANIPELDLISTTSPNYPWVDKHVFISPSISLEGQHNEGPVRFIKPSQRLIR